MLLTGTHKIPPDTLHSVLDSLPVSPPPPGYTCTRAHAHAHTHYVPFIHCFAKTISEIYYSIQDQTVHEGCNRHTKYILKYI